MFTGCILLTTLKAATVQAAPAAVPLLTTKNGRIIDWRNQAVEFKGIGWYDHSKS